MIPPPPCDTFGSHLSITSMQANICPRRHKGANNRKITTFGSNRKRRVENIVITMNVRIGLGTK